MKKSIIFLTLLFAVSFAANAADTDKKSCAPKKGYAGFSEIGINSFSSYLSTTHGYQFSPYFYLGGGMLAQFHKKDDSFVLFEEVKATLNKKTSPFIGLKGGYDLALSEFYLCPSAGCRIGIFKNVAINVGLSLDLRKDRGGLYLFQSIEF